MISKIHQNQGDDDITNFKSTEKNHKNTFLSLPNDIFSLVFSYLPFQNIIQLQRVNLQLQLLVKRDSIWKNLLLYHHPQSKDVVKKNFYHVFTQIAKYHQKGKNLRITGKKFESKFYCVVLHILEGLL